MFNANLIKNYLSIADDPNGVPYQINHVAFKLYEDNMAEYILNMSAIFMLENFCIKGIQNLPAEEQEKYFISTAKIKEMSQDKDNFDTNFDAYIDSVIDACQSIEIPVTDWAFDKFYESFKSTLKGFISKVLLKRTLIFDQDVFISPQAMGFITNFTSNPGVSLLMFSQAVAFSALHNCPITTHFAIGYIGFPNEEDPYWQNIWRAQKVWSNKNELNLVDQAGFWKLALEGIDPTIPMVIDLDKETFDKFAQDLTLIDPLIGKLHNVFKSGYLMDAIAVDGSTQYLLALSIRESHETVDKEELNTGVINSMSVESLYVMNSTDSESLVLKKRMEA